MEGIPSTVTVDSFVNTSMTVGFKFLLLKREEY
jgi:hypothetical protein